uniref:Uncharacterized protein n=1 Tax=Ixodes ricinus TaxID=34613 RepID=A0A6B0U7D0_IXORI
MSSYQGQKAEICKISRLAYRRKPCRRLLTSKRGTASFIATAELGVALAAVVAEAVIATATTLVSMAGPRCWSRRTSADPCRSCR